MELLSSITACKRWLLVNTSRLPLKSPPSDVADDQRDKSPDSNPSAKIKSATPVGLAVEVNVCEGVAVGVLVRVGVDVGVNIRVGVEV